MIFKIRALDHLRLYVGIDYGTDGFTALVGAKLAGIKVIVPWTGAEKVIPLYQQENPFNTLTYPLLICVGFFVSSYFLNKYSKKRSQVQLTKWVNIDQAKLL